MSSVMHFRVEEKSDLKASITDSDIPDSHFHAERRDQVRLVILASCLVASEDDEEWQESFEFVFQHLQESKFPLDSKFLMGWVI
jgi:hypothetical protein